MATDLMDETSEIIGVPEGFPPLLIVLDSDQVPPKAEDIQRFRQNLHSAWSKTGIAFMQGAKSIHQLIDGQWLPVTTPPAAEPPASSPTERPASVPAAVWVALAISFLVNVATLAAILTR